MGLRSQLGATVVPSDKVLNSNGFRNSSRCTRGLRVTMYAVHVAQDEGVS